MKVEGNVKSDENEIKKQSREKNGKEWSVLLPELFEKILTYLVINESQFETRVGAYCTWYQLKNSKKIENDIRQYDTIKALYDNIIYGAPILPSMWSLLAKYPLKKCSLDFIKKIQGGAKIENLITCTDCVKNREEISSVIKKLSEDIDLNYDALDNTTGIECLDKLLLEKETQLIELHKLFNESDKNIEKNILNIAKKLCQFANTFPNSFLSLLTSRFSFLIQQSSEAVNASNSAAALRGNPRVVHIHLMLLKKLAELTRSEIHDTKAGEDQFNLFFAYLIVSKLSLFNYLFELPIAEFFQQILPKEIEEQVVDYSIKLIIFYLPIIKLNQENECFINLLVENFHVYKFDYKEEQYFKKNGFIEKSMTTQLCTDIFNESPMKLKKDRSFISKLHLFKEATFMLEYLSEDDQNEVKSNIITYFSDKVFSFKYEIEMENCRDIEKISSFIRKRGASYLLLSEEMKKNRDIIFKATNSATKESEFYSRGLPKIYFGDREIFFRYIKNLSWEILSAAVDQDKKTDFQPITKFLSNFEVVWEAAVINPRILCLVDEEHKFNKEIVMNAMQNNPETIFWMDPLFLQNETIVREFLSKKNAYTARFLNEHPELIKWASNSIINDKELMFMVTKKAEVLEYLEN